MSEIDLIERLEDLPDDDKHRQLCWQAACAIRSLRAELSMKEVWLLNRHNWIKKHSIECPACGGGGEPYDGVKCAECDGFGRIAHDHPEAIRIKEEEDSIFAPDDQEEIAF